MKKALAKNVKQAFYVWVIEEEQVGLKKRALARMLWIDIKNQCHDNNSSQNFKYLIDYQIPLQ